MRHGFGRRELPPATKKVLSLEEFPVGQDVDFEQWILEHGDRNDPMIRDVIRTILRERREEDPSNGASPLGDLGLHGVFVLCVENLRGVRPGRRAFALRGVAWKAVLLLVVFVASLVGQVWFMDVTGAAGRSDLWPEMVFVPWCEPLAVVVLFVGIFSPFVALGVGALLPRWWPVTMACSVSTMVGVGALLGGEVGRAWLWDRYVATGLRPVDGFVDLSSYDHRPVALYWNPVGPWWPLGLAAGVLLVGGFLLMARERLFGNVFVWLFDRVVFGSGVVCAVASVGLFLAGHGLGDSMVVLVVAALVVGLLVLPLDVLAVVTCVEKRRGAEGEWLAAFALVSEMVFVVGVCVGLAAMI